MQDHNRLTPPHVLVNLLTDVIKVKDNENNYQKAMYCVSYGHSSVPGPVPLSVST